MALNDVYLARVVGTYLGEDCVNRFWFFQSTAGNPGAKADYIRSAIKALWVDTLIELQVPGFSWTNIEVINYKNPVDYANVALVGSVGENINTFGLPSWVVVRMMYSRSMPGRNYPSKAVSGIPQAFQNGNNLFSSPAEDFEAIAAALTSFTADGALFTQVSFKNNPPLNYPDGFDSEPQDIVSVRSVQLGSQNSRKPE